MIADFASEFSEVTICGVRGSTPGNSDGMFYRPAAVTLDHIGLLDSDGQVIQAEDLANGVHGETRYNPMDWSRRSNWRMRFFASGTGVLAL